MKKIGEIYKGRSGNYLVYKIDRYLSSLKYSVYHTANDTELFGLRRLKNFYFKKEALDFVQHEEGKYLSLESYLQSQVNSGLLTENEMFERLEGGNNDFYKS
jgi:hypothetical protein